MSSITRPAPPDQRQRERALEAGRSILEQAPAGSGKTDLLTRRLLRLLIGGRMLRRRRTRRMGLASLLRD